MTEEFIQIAIDAFGNSNNDIDKFELLLRRGVMSYKPMMPTLPTISQNFNISEELADELASINIEEMSDEQVMILAQKMGIGT
jgi:hypothetical protein